jgi:class 3 adenylate cyclase/uncharacterized protein HemY
MKKNCLYLILYLFFLVGLGKKSYAQQVILNKEIQFSKKNADSLFDAAVAYQNNAKYIEALNLFEQSLKIYQTYNLNKEIGTCLTKIGNSYYFQGEYSKAMSYYDKSIKVYEKINNTKGVSSALNNIGAIQFYLGNYPKALEYYKRALTIQEKLGDEKTIATTTQNIGGIYFQIGDYKNTMLYYNKAYSQIKKTDDLKETSKILNSIGLVYIKKNDFVKANEYLNQSLELAEKTNHKQIKIEILSSLGELFYFKKDFQKALEYYNICLKISTENNNLQYKSSSLIGIGNILHQLGKDNKAIDKCLFGLKLAEKLQSLSVKKNACECLYKSHKSNGNTSKALNYFEKSHSYNDSLKSKETSDRVMKMEFQKQQFLDSLAHAKKENFIQLKHTKEIQKKEKQRNLIIISLCFILVIAVGLWSRLNFVRKAQKALRIEKDNSERLLLNILPEEIAEELKANGYVDAKNFNLVSILFTDFKSFTETSERLSPRDLVEEINVCFKAFDMICGKYNIEKIKTIGDAYMAAGGIPKPDINSLKNTVSAGLEMQNFMIKRKAENDADNKPAFEMRLGIHAGPIVAGIVGVKKFQYDVWGDTVNTASRMESSGEVGKVNISESLYDLIKNEPEFSFEYRGMVNAKGKGEIKMYFVNNKFSIL